MKPFLYREWSRGFVRRAVSPVKRPRGDDPDRDVGHTQQQQQQQVRVCTTTTMEALCNRLPRTDNVRPSVRPARRRRHRDRLFYYSKNAHRADAFKLLGGNYFVSRRGGRAGGRRRRPWPI